MATAGLTTTTTAIKTTHDGQVIENLEIWVTSGDAITVTHDNVIIRNCIIHHVNGNGVVVNGANNVTIEDSLVVNDSPPAGIGGENEQYDVMNIYVLESSGFKADHVTLRDGSTGINLVDSPNADLTYIEGYNFHGPFPGGQLVQFNRSPGGSLSEFYCYNDPAKSRPEDNISVYESQNVTITNGVIDGNNSASGVGVMFEGDSQGGLVRNVDAIHMGNGAFSSYSNDVTFDDTRSFDGINVDQGRGKSLSNGLIWNVSGDGVSITNSTYTRPGNPDNIVWEGEKAVVVGVKEATSATPMSHITNVFDWTDAGSPGDTTPPTVSVVMSDTSLTVGETATATLTFSEAPVGFSLADVSATGGTLSSFTQVDATHFTVKFTPTSNINIANAKVSVSNGYTDAAGNTGAAGASSNFTVNTVATDTTPPTVSVAMSDPFLISGETATATLTFSEAPVGLSLADLSATGGTLSNFTQVDATHFTVKFTPTSNINISNAKVSVSNGYTDAAGNTGAAGASANFAVNTTPVDTTPPTVSVSISDTSLTVGETATATLTFSEAPVGLSLADLSATGGTLSNFTQVDATHFTVKFTPTSNINISNAKVSVSNGYTDAAGNTGAAGASSNFAVNTTPVDTTPPTVSVAMSDTSLTVGETATATLTFSEAPVGLSLADISATGGALSSFTQVDATHFTVKFTPSAGINIANAKVSVSNGYTDAAGNTGASGASSNFAVNTVATDTTAPTVAVSISDTSLTVGETATATLTFSEAPVGLSLADISATGGALSSFTQVDATHFTVKFTPTSNINISNAKVSVSNGYTDAAGNTGAAGASANFAVNTTPVDTTPPTVSVAISDTSLKVGETATATFTFSEAPVGFSLADVSATGGALSNFTQVDATHYSAKFTPSAGIQISNGRVSVAASTYTDAASNAGASGTSSNFAIDTKAPTVSMTLSDDSLEPGETATVTFTFSEAPVGFDISDIAVDGGTLSAFAKIDSTHYTATFTPSFEIPAARASPAAELQESMIATISINAGAFTDGAGNAVKTGASASLQLEMAVPAPTPSGKVKANESYSLENDKADLHLLGDADINGTGNGTDNRVVGNDGRNVLAGGLGNDILAGRGGKDSFLFDRALDNKLNVDRIDDFQHKSEKIILDQSIFTEIDLGKLDRDAFYSSKKAIEGVDDEHRIIYNMKTGALRYDVDGAGGADSIKFAVLDDVPHDISAKDFLIVA